MLAKAHKLHLRQQKQFFKTAQRLGTDQFTIYWKRSPVESPGLQFQVTIAKKTVPTSAERNALKRTMYDLCAVVLKKFPSNNLQIAIVLRSKEKKQLSAVLEQTLKKLLTTYS